MKIRAYRTEDYAPVVDLVTTVLAEYGFSAHIGGVQRDLEDFGAQRRSLRNGELEGRSPSNERGIEGGYGRAKAGFWVAELDGKVVGTVAIRPKEDVTCELKRLYVSKDARGHGIGRALYAHAEAFARECGYERIWLDSSRKFAEARRLYEKNGFVLLEELANDWCDNVYEKRLTGAAVRCPPDPRRGSR